MADDGIVKLFDVAVIEQPGAHRPRCASRVHLEQGADGPALLLSRGEQKPWADEVVREQALRLELSAAPRRQGIGVVVNIARDQALFKAAEELFIRPIVLADASWLSRFGFAARLELRMLEELAIQTTSRPFDDLESMVLLGYPRMAPHALAYRIGPFEQHKTWFRVDRRWVSQGEMFTVQDTERMRSARKEMYARPWLRYLTLPDRDRLQHFSPWHEVQRWAFHHAFERIERPAQPHEELMGLLMCSPEDAIVDARALGEELTRFVNGLEESFAAHGRAQREELLAYLAELEAEGEEYDDEPDDEGSDHVFDLRPSLYELASPEFSTTAGSLFDVIAAFEEQLGL